MRAALAIADSRRKTLEAVQVRLADISSRTAKLGNPPDPIAAASVARRTHIAAVRTAKSLLPPTKPPAVTAGAWVVLRTDRTDKPALPEANGVAMATKFSDTSYEFKADMARTTGMGQRVEAHALYAAEWTTPPAVLRGGSTFTLPVRYTNRLTTVGDGKFAVRNDWRVEIVSDTLLHSDPKERRIVAVYDERYQFEKGYLLGYAPPGVEMPQGTDTVQVKVVVPNGRDGQRLILGLRASHNAIVDHPNHEGRMYRVYHYRWTSDPNAIANAGKGGSKDDPAEAERKAKEDAVWFHRDNITIIRRNLDRDRAELEKETDPARRAALEFRILQAESEIVAEQDLIKSIESGQIVHSRTPFDDFARDRFVQSIRENQSQMEQFQRANAALQRLAAMLPPGEAEEARRFIDRQVTRETMAKLDIEQVKKVASALHLKVTGYIERDRAKAEEGDAWATYNLETAERFKSAADKGLFVCSLFGGKPVMMAYQAATGYIEGGPKEAILRAAAWYSTPAYVASEALRGYERLDENGQPRGWMGAAKDAATAYVMAKLFEYGAGKAKQWITGRAPDGLTVAERRQLAEFQRGRTAGELKAREFARAQADLERAARQGASPQQITRLQANVRRQAAIVHADPHAKNYLKFKGDFHAQRAYNAHMRANHAETEARFQDLMQRRGWNRQPLREFRNAASGDSVGMDHDIGLDEAAAAALRLNGRPASLYQWQRDAQRCWEEAYRSTTGQSARASWETVTTSIHGESYKDLSWLCGDATRISRAWGQQAADVTRYKNWHMLNDPSLGRMLRLQEVSRGTAKDMATKLQKLFSAARPQSPAAAQALQNARRHWTKVQSILEAFGRNDIDPIYASRRIREVTGGKDIPQVVDEAAQLMESLARHVGR